MRVTTILLATAVMITGCSGTPDTDPSPEPGVLTVGVGEQPVWRAPRDRMIGNALYTPLVDYDPATGKITPRAAESVTSTDQITWTIKLRPGQYHDGTKVTATSYVDAWATAAEKPISYKNIVPVDDSTIQLTMERPASYVPAFLASVRALPVRSAKPLDGNGPFKVETPWDEKKGGRLVRVNQVGAKAQRIDLKVYPDLAVAFDEVKAGKLDLVVDFPGSRHASMHQDFAARHVVWPKPEASYLLFGPELADPVARYAIAMAIDRKAVTEGPMDNQYDPAARLYPPAVAPGERSGTCRACNFDPAAAKTLRTQADLTAARFSDGVNPDLPAVRSQVQTNLGLKTDTGPAVRIQIHTWGIDSPHELFEGLDLPSIKPFLDAAAASGDPVVQAENYRLVENEVLRELQLVPLWTAHGHAVWAERVRDVSTTAAHGVDLTAITLG
nr:ABC transporter substrate-binding protein [Kibdelosporangium sp. MJ126-NF4]CEL20453.1 Oligopeptide ABC transporter, periplasmic oligopeptide-binding protein OppA (TC 3.A.1.5.1) [Kibdelosporangium sp. MJ126-NF4]CTQ97678.1 Oligopeptide ABC transporter, periplasmic oligopeptide-binding protein OppA (TC 3.A.1.5.1) [Kibdelosporangium sp. MJ126-NF4]